MYNKYMIASKKINIQKKHLLIITGIILMLLSLIIIISPFSYLSKISYFLVAVFGFTGYWVMMPTLFLYGSYLTFKTKITKFRFDLSLIGLLLISIALLILSSIWGSNGQIVTLSDNANNVETFIIGVESDTYNTIPFLTYSNCIDIFSSLLREATSFGTNLKYITLSTELGGGYCGYVLAGILNSSITQLGTMILSWIIAISGLILLFNRLLATLCKKIKNKFSIKKIKKVTTESNDDYNSFVLPLEKDTTNEQNYENHQETEYNETKFKELIKESTIAPKLDDNSIQALRIESLNRNSGFKKAFFSFSDEKDVSQNEHIKEDIIIANSLETSEKYEENSSLVEIQEVKEVINDVKEVKEVINVLPSIEKTTVNENTQKTNEIPFVLPSIDLLQNYEHNSVVKRNELNCERIVEIFNQKFIDFKIGASVSDYIIGPTLTSFNIKLEPTCLVSSIGRIYDDLNKSLKGRIDSFKKVVYGQEESAFLVRNEHKTNVGLKESYLEVEDELNSPLEVIFGKSPIGEVMHTSIDKFPHAVIAGTTGSGKSICLHTILVSLLLRNDPDKLKLLIIDPKGNELIQYDELPHLLCSNISDPKQAYVALKKLVDVMEKRFALLKQYQCSNINSYNRIAKKENLKTYPNIVIIIDEYADLKDVCKEVEAPIKRITQKARAAGIYVIVATQRPSTDVVGGLIKANLPAHIALRVGTSTDSQTILGHGGAEKLLGHGDMLIQSNESFPGQDDVRVQGCYLDVETDVKSICDFIKQQRKPSYDADFLDLDEEEEEEDNYIPNSSLNAMSEVLRNNNNYEMIIEDIQKRPFCSISYLQRQFSFNFNKAKTIFTRLQEDGYIDYEDIPAKGCRVLKRLDTSIDSNKGSIDQCSFGDNE